MEAINKKQVVSYIIKVLFSNIVNVIAGVVVGFVIPIVLDVEGYGFYKTFTLYVSYIGFFSLGIIDGIVLKYGSNNYDELNKEKFRSYFFWYFLIHVIFTLVLILLSLFIFKGEYRFIFMLFALDIIAVNVFGYFQQISQITMRFNELSVRTIVKSALTILSVVILYIMYINHMAVDYRLYIYIILIMNYLLTFWYIFTYRNIIFGKKEKLSISFKEMFSLIKTGLPLLFANLSATLILTLDRQFVSMFFSTSEYAVYAFAYNMLSLVTVATSAISTVIYPTLKRTDETALKDNYDKLIMIVLVFVNFALCCYYPLCFIIDWILPKYTDSLVIFRIIFPGLVISSCITVIMHNYYKTIGKNKIYFIKSLFIILLSVAANIGAYFIRKSMLDISIASIIVMLFWYLFIERYFIKEFKVKWKKNFLYMLIMVVFFYLITFIKNYFIGFGLHIVLFAVITGLYYLKEIKQFRNKRKQKKQGEGSSDSLV